MAQIPVLSATTPSRAHPASVGLAPSCLVRLARAYRRPVQSRWTMPGFFAAAVLAAAAILSALALVADPAGVTYGLAPVWQLGHITIPVSVCPDV
jgi:hypothetical protein